MAGVARFEADTLKGAIEAKHAIRQVGKSARIEKGLASDSARAPVLGNLVRLSQAEIGEILLRR